MNIKRLIIYASALLLPPFAIGTLLAFSNLSSLMLRKTPAALTRSADSLQPPPLRGKPKAAVLISNEGTQITDLLGPFEILAESGVFDVFTVAPQRTISPTTGSLDIFPHYSFHNAPEADLLVIPAVLDPLNPELAKWLKLKAKNAKLVLTLCEGARLAVQAGLIHKMNATSHFLAIPELRSLDTSSNWLSSEGTDLRYVISGNVITSAGVTASLDAALFAVEKFAGLKTAQDTAARLGYSWLRASNPGQPSQASSQVAAGTGISDFLPLFFRAGFRWVKDRLAVLIYPGIDELRLAALLDVFARTPDYQVFTFAPIRQVYRSAHGLDLIPTENASEMLPADLLMIPAENSSGQASAQAESHEMLKDSTLKKWLEERQVPLASFAPTAPGTAYDESLEKLLEKQGPHITQFVAKMIEYPRKSRFLQPTKTSSIPAENWPFSLWIKPLLIALAGLWIGIWGEKRFRKAYRILDSN